MSVYRDDFHTPAPGVTIIDYSPRSFHEQYIADHKRALGTGRLLASLLQLAESASGYTNNLSTLIDNMRKLEDDDE